MAANKAEECEAASPINSSKLSNWLNRCVKSQPKEDLGKKFFFFYYVFRFKINSFVKLRKQ